MEIKESAENYLETILVLQKRNGDVRAVDIANELSFSKPSISNAMKRLRENGYIEVDKLDGITLTERGKEIAYRIYERHLILSNYFMQLGVSEEIAKKDACRIEHVISEETFQKIKELSLKIRQTLNL